MNNTPMRAHATKGEETPQYQPINPALNGYELWLVLDKLPSAKGISFESCEKLPRAVDIPTASAESYTSVHLDTFLFRKKKKRR
jgi:hypothetical protein